MHEQKSLELVKALYKRSQAGRLEWKPVDNNQLRTELGEFTLDLLRVHDQDYPDEPDYFLTLVDSQGRDVETISNISLRPLMDQKDEDGLNPYQLFRLTFEHARRKAFGVDAAVDSVLKKLTS